MPRRRSPYPAEFRYQIVELVRAGRTPEELSREFEPSAQAIRNWVAQADRDEGRRPSALEQALGAGLVGFLGGDFFLDAGGFGLKRGQVVLELLGDQELQVLGLRPHDDG